MKLKKMLPLVLTGILVLSGCANTNKNQPNTSMKQPAQTIVTEPSNKDQTQKTDVKDKQEKNELIAIFPLVKGTTWKYNGYAEYGHSMQIDDVKTENSDTIVNIKGQVEDGSGEKGKTFIVKYMINKDAIIENINYDYTHGKTINSIIPDKIILKTPLKVGTSWSQKFNYKNKEYTAQTKITNINPNQSTNAMEYTTETTVEGIDGYLDNIYKEKRVYEVGKGMISFSNSQPLEKSYGPLGDDKYYNFGYSLSSVK